ncbi:B12D domain containing protein [Asbolus verrucosus]|uniref:B12D domain containing protein n=1 Tax=Asbolus verrucosus TaxID=1661398 RepID=A0A482V8F5_ASBVE|nr:B12D domain containing protein [Asbolus verrucosus]
MASNLRYPEHESVKTGEGKATQESLGNRKVYLPNGAIGGVSYAVRLALHSPDVQWNRRKGEISNEEYRAKQYKLYSPSVDYSKLESPAPRY